MIVLHQNVVYWCKMFIIILLFFFIALDSPSPFLSLVVPYLSFYKHTNTHVHAYTQTPLTFDLFFSCLYFVKIQTIILFSRVMSFTLWSIVIHVFLNCLFTGLLNSMNFILRYIRFYYIFWKKVISAEKDTSDPTFS